jgi:hypothetical protein
MEAGCSGVLPGTSNNAFDPDLGSAVAAAIRARKIPHPEDATSITFAQLLTREIGGFERSPGYGGVAQAKSSAGSSGSVAGF